MGEKLIAFRDDAGRVGAMDHRCPRRCASLFFGRNEDGGIRCIYHGWTFDTDGNLLDLPNLPADQDFKQKVKAKAYRVTERAGLIWVYMGARVSCRRYRLGTMYRAYRPAEDGKTYWRFAHFGFPIWTRVPQGVDAPEVYARARSGECVMQGDDWQAVYDERLKHAVRPVALRDAGE